MVIVPHACADLFPGLDWTPGLDQRVGGACVARVDWAGHPIDARDRSRDYARGASVLWRGPAVLTSRNLRDATAAVYELYDTCTVAAPRRAGTVDSHRTA